MKKTIIAGGVIVILTIGAYFANSAYQTRASIEAAKPAVKVATIYTADFLENETKSSNITFGEYFKKADSAVDEIDKKIIEIRSLRNDKNASTLDQATDAMKLDQDLIRELSQYYRHSLESSSAEKSFDRAKEAADSATSSYEVQWRSKEMRTALDDQLSALKKMQTTRGEVYILMGKVKSGQPKLESAFGSDVIVPVSILDTAMKKFAPKKSS